MKKHLEIAVYGKGGIGKSTISANLTAAAAMKGNRVLQIGCDPKHDSTRLLMHGTSIPTVLDVLRDKGEDRMRPEDILKHSSLDAANGQIDCIEAGGPKPGVGCAGRGIISAFEYLNRNHIREQYDYVVYDVLGDVVCGGFAVPVRREYADAVFLVTSGEYMALYAANNILRGIRNFDGDRYQRVAGIIFNERKLEDEDGRVRRFAEAVGLPVLARVPRSEAFARAEEVNRTVMEQPGFEEEKRVFRKLADLLTGDMKLYPANPLTDEEHERIVLGRKEAQTAGQTEAEVNGFAAERSGDATALTGPASAKLSGGKNASNAESAAAAVSESAGGSNASEEKAENLSSYTDSLDSGSSPNTFTRPPLYGCAFNGAASSAVHLTDAIVIAHGPKACAFYTMQTISSPGKKNIFNRGVLLPASISPNFVSTNIGHAEAVFGGIDLLRSAVQKAMAKKPGAVIVVSTCVSGIIGDDLCSVEALSTEEIPVIAIAADGDMNGDYMEGIKMAQEILADRLIRKDLPKSDRCVNIIGEAGIASNTASNYAVMERLLNAMGIRINCRFLGNATVDEVRNFTRAPLNILASDSPDTVRLKDYLVRNYGCAFLEAPLPVGFQATKNWLMGIAAFFGCEEEAEKLIESEERTYQEKVAFLRSRLEGKKVFLTTINANLDWLLDTAYDVGLDFVYIGVHNYLRTPLSISVHPDRQEKAEEIQDPAKTRELIRRLKPEILLSAYTPETEEEHMITDTLPMIPDLGMMSAAEIMERWIRLMNTKRKGEWEHDRKLFEKYFR